MSPRTTGTIGGPGFVADHSSVERNSGRQVAWDLVGENRRTTAGQTVTLAAAALAAATSITVDPLTAHLADNTVLDFGGGKFARINNAAGYDAGDTALTVDAIPTALAGTESAIVSGSGQKALAAGTVVAERDTSGVLEIYPAVDSGDASIGVIETDANELSQVEAISGYGVITHGKLYEALLPDATGTPRAIPATQRTELLALGFSFEPYTDTSAA
jgi:hypothetical protein